MAANERPNCKFGGNCYRKNPQHLEKYRHPKRKNEEEPKESQKKLKAENSTKGKNKEDFFGKKKVKEHELSDDEERETDKTPLPLAETGNCSIVDSDDEKDDTSPPESPSNIQDNIKRKFLVDMPDDFYQFWEFCKSENPKCPTDALLDSVGFQLVGPYDILAGKHKGVQKNQYGKCPNFLLHWRYYYDPPEFQTVIRGDDKAQFHLGYFRDDPNEMPVFVAANSAKHGCAISPKGDNLFAAVCFYIDEELKKKDSTKKTKLKDLSERLKDFAKKHNQDLEMKSKSMKEREKRVVCRSFHGAGIVVPVDENEVGYREVPETPANLKKIFKNIKESKTEAERDKHFEALQELITLVQFANDECDYGEGLELGLDLFLYGGDVFHATVKQLLSMAYMLLHRREFAAILEAHLKHRKHDSDLSQLK